MRRKWIVPGVLVMITWVMIVQAQELIYEDLVEPVAQGSVNWTQGTVTATGIGFPPDNITDPARARVMAERAAFVVALRNLLELVKGVRVDATTVVENFMLKSDVIQARVSGFVKGAKTVGKKMNPDGSVEVTVAVSLWGETALMGILADEKRIGQQVPEAVPSPEGYTDLILDARGLGVKPAVFPVIKDESGNVIYSPEHVNRKDAVQSGMVRYVSAKPEIKRQQFEGEKPDFQGGRKSLKIKALGKDKKFSVNLVISGDDAKKLKSSNKIADFLREGRVMIVIDVLIGGSEGRLEPNAWRWVSEK